MISRRSPACSLGIASALALATIGFASAALAANVYVDGSGTCNGLAPCFTTIQLGVNNASANDQVVVFPGTYAESVGLASMGSAIAGSAGNLSLVTANTSGTPTPGTVTVNASGSATAAAFFATSFPGSVRIDGFTVHSTQSDGIRLSGNNGSVTLANVVSNGNGDGSSPDATGDDGVQVSTTGSGHDITLTNCTANGNSGPFGDGFDLGTATFPSSVTIIGCIAENNVGTGDNDGFDFGLVSGDITITNTTVSGNGKRGIWIETLQGTSLSVTLTNVTASENGDTGIEIGKGNNGTIGALTVANIVAHGNGNLGLRIINLASGGTHSVHGSMICGNALGGLSLLTPNATVDATGDLWGPLSGPTHPGGGGSGDTVFDSANGAQGTVDFTPFIDSIFTSVLPNPVVTGQPATVSFQYSGGSGSVFLGPGPGSANDTPPFTFTTDNGTLTSSTGSGASVTERIVGAAGTVSVTLVTATSGSVTVTGASPCNLAAGGGTEICDNCFDDNGDGQTDRADPMCTPPANGSFAGIGDVSAAKGAVKCQKAIEKAGAKLFAKKLARLDKCVDLAFACVQLKNGDASCLEKARPKCDKQLAGITADEAKTQAAIEKACDDSQGKGISLGDALAVTGLGFSAEEVPCNVTLTSLSDIAGCIVARHECGAERAIVAAAPRAAEMLKALNHDPAGEFPCLALASASNGIDASGAGLANPAEAKAAVKCQAALEKAGLNLAKLELETVQKCVDPGAACIQLKPGDSACRTKATTKCQAAFQKFASSNGPLVKLLTATAKKCATPDLIGTDLDAAGGLGFASVTAPNGRCSEFTLTAADPTTTIIECAGLQHLCEGAQMLEREVPRLHEIADFLNVQIPQGGL